MTVNKIEMKEVESSSIKAIGWKLDILKIEFLKGGIYTYDPFPAEDWEKFKAAESTGKFFYKNIRHDKKIVCTKIKGNDNA